MVKKILLIDDSRTSRRLTSIVLSDAGYAITEAADGVEGLEYILTDPYLAVVLCDFEMPNMDGLTMLERVSAMAGGRPMPPIVIMSANGDGPCIQKAKAAGAAAYIVKPFKPHALLTMVKTLAGQSRRGKAASSCLPTGP